MKQFARHGLIVFAGLMAGNFFIYIYYVLVSRIVGVESYGILIALLSAILLLSVPAIIAAAVIAKLAADFHAANDTGRLRRLANHVDRYGATVGLAVFIAVALASTPLELFFHLTSPLPVIVSGSALGLSLWVTAQRGILQGRHFFGSYAASYIVDAVGRCVFGAIGALRFGVVGAIAGFALDLAVTVLFNCFAARRGTTAASRLELPLTFGGSATQIGLTLLAVNVMLYYDTILVRHYFSAETAGLYGAAALVARAVYTIVGFVPVILLPNASQRAARGERPTPLILMAGAVVSFVGVLAIAMSVIAPALLVRIIAGPAFIEARQFVVPYVVALVALSGANAVANYNIGLGRFKQSVPLAVIALAQIIVVVAHHGSPHDILMTILIGDCCALGITLYRVASPH